MLEADFSQVPEDCVNTPIENERQLIEAIQGFLSKNELSNAVNVLSENMIVLDQNENENIINIIALFFAKLKDEDCFKYLKKAAFVDENIDNELPIDPPEYTQVFLETEMPPSYELIDSNNNHEIEYIEKLISIIKSKDQLLAAVHGIKNSKLPHVQLLLNYAKNDFDQTYIQNQLLPKFSENTNTGLMVLGAVLSLTVLLAIIGIPLIFFASNEKKKCERLEFDSKTTESLRVQCEIAKTSQRNTASRRLFFSHGVKN